MVPRGGAEIPDPRLAGARQQAPARELVARPLADDGAGQIADVVLIEHEDRAKPRLCERLARATEAVRVQALEIDALFEIDLHVAGRLQWPIPAMARINVVGADGASGGRRRLASHTALRVASLETLAPAREHDEVLIGQELVIRNGHEAGAARDADERLGRNAPAPRRAHRRLAKRPIDRRQSS